MKSVIVKINDLIDAHGKTYTKCQDPNCEICNQIRNLSKELWPGEKGEQKKVVEPFEKRMTKERYLTLKRRGYSDKTIASKYGVSITTIAKWKKKYFTKEEREKMQKTKQNDTKQQTEDQTIQIHVDGKMVSSTIAETVSVDKAENKTIQIEPEVIVKAKLQAKTWKQRFEETMAAKEQLQEQNTSLENEVQRLRQKIKDLEAEKSRYFADYMDLEQELKGLRLFAFEKLKKDVYGA
jgi:transposase